eukprot:TRINITY_DN6655_c0_g3_i6.p1 TRINITY_DN6655_c0_g3~~TRINITY_DN6655_c0_g3_i6.p1  ORF type:complete len:236 (+),score=69.16 TRINITY_DN6655_c0_g3_i6:61-768(+)
MTSEGTSLDCQQSSTACSVTWSCARCELLEGSVKPSIAFASQQANAIANSIFFNLSTSTGLKDSKGRLRLSSVAAMLRPSKPQYTFKGRVPTNVTLLAMQTLFTNDVTDGSEGGYHFTFQNYQLGSQVDRNGFQYSAGLYVTYVLERSDATFFIRHSPAQTLGLFFTSLFGSISALVAGMGALLAAVETCQTWWAREQRRRQKHLRRALEHVSPLELAAGKIKPTPPVIDQPPSS